MCSFCRWKPLKLTPDVLELKEALPRAEPLRSEHGAFGVPLTRLGVVAEIDAVGGRGERHLVHPDDFAFAEGCDLETRAATFLDDSVKDDRRPGRCVFLVMVMPLENLSVVIVAAGLCRGAHDVEKEVHADGKIRPIEKSSPGLFDI